MANATSEFDSLKHIKHIPVVSLPVYPPLSNESLKENKKENEVKIPVVTWNISTYHGIQIISHNITDSVLKTAKEEEIYSVNDYRTMLLTINLVNKSVIRSDLTASFIKGTVPINFSFSDLPDFYQNCFALKTDIYLTKGFILPKTITLFPYAGYTFSQYQMQKLSLSSFIADKKFQSFIIGSRIVVNPTRIISMDFGISFAPIVIPDGEEKFLFQVAYETGISVEAGPLSIAARLVTTNSIEQYVNVSNIVTFKVSEIGLRFKLNI